jgi:hypothetical protein
VTLVLPLFNYRSTKMLVALGCVICALLANLSLILVDRKKSVTTTKEHQRNTMSFLQTVKTFSASYWMCVFGTELNFFYFFY